MRGHHFSRWSRIAAALILLLTSAQVVAGAPLAQDEVVAPVEPLVLEQIASEGQATYWVILEDQADLSDAYRIPGWEARGAYVYRTLTAHAAATQAALLASLTKQGIPHQSFWVLNAIRVTSGADALTSLRRQPEVAEILASRTFEIPKPLPGAPQDKINAVEWNIDRINAPQVWSTYGDTGQGIVVGSIDTGAQYDHPALVSQYRGSLGGGSYDHNYNWYDPSQVCGYPSTVPCDNIGHGTHTMGTMAGDDGAGNQIGVAPGVRWIAAKGCEYDWCSDAALTASAQWILAPTDLAGANPRPDLRPHVVNNSWGGGSGNPWYQAYVQAWRASGIFPAFSAGNPGSYCGGAGSPGDYPESYASGAFDVGNAIAWFSGRGPGGFGDIKPNIAAPGVSVRSSVPDNAYAWYDGTSMASPHTAATVALMWSAAPALVGDIAETFNLLDMTAIDTEDLTCGGDAADNNVWGEGRLDAFAAVSASPMGPTGALQGTVTDAVTALPVEGALVQAVGPISRQMLTDAAGFYSFPVLSTGDYDVTVSRFAYLTQTALGVAVSEGATTVQDIALAPAPAHSVSGYVFDDLGDPVANATVTILNTPLPPATTDASGHYSFPSVPEGSYSALAAAGRCNDPQTQPLTVAGDAMLDFSLPARVDAFGYRCKIETLAWEDATHDTGMYGDDTATEIALPFPIPFYGQTYNTAWVSTNGFLNFLEWNGSLGGGSIPTPWTPNGAIYAFWDDNYVDWGNASVDTELLGVAPHRRFVIEWDNIAFCCISAERISVEVILYEDGEILTQYTDIDPVWREQGGSATLGIENETGTIALQYSADEPIITDGLAVRYIPPPMGWLEGTVTNASTGMPVPNAAIHSEGASSSDGTTDANGFYRVALRVGGYDVTASAIGYVGQTAAGLVVSEDATTVQDFALVPMAIVQGSVTDANDGLPIQGAAVRALQAGSPVSETSSADDGSYRLLVPPGQTTIEASKLRYGTLTAELLLGDDGATYTQDFALPTPRAEVSPAALNFLVPAGETRTQMLALRNTGSLAMTWEIKELGSGTPMAAYAVSAAEAGVESLDPNARTTRGVTAPERAALQPQFAGEVLAAWPPSGMGLAWGAGYDGEVWLSDAYNLYDKEFSEDGTPTGVQWPTGWVGAWPGDMAYDAGRGWMCQVNVGGDNGIYCWDPDTGEITGTITGDFSWISQRGLAYRPDDDSFYVGGWNEGRLYHVAGFSHPTPGAVLDSCYPPDYAISGLAWNPTFNIVWEATNSYSDTIYALDPTTCGVIATLPHPAPYYNGGGLAMDPNGNLWMIGQYPNMVYLMDSGIPTFSDVPWITEDPAAGTLPAGGELLVAVTVDASDLAPGVYTADLVIRTDSGRVPDLTVPVQLVVTDYYTGVNTGGKQYLDLAGNTWLADRAYTAGSWGYIGKTGTLSTKSAIGGTEDDPLYKDARAKAVEYRFDGLPEGRYQVELRFAEIQNHKPGRRQFDVIVEGQLVLPAHDIAAEVGAYTVDDHSFYFTVHDGSLNIRLATRRSFGEPLINAIRVIRRPDMKWD